jgi:DNA ligase (NAD+)
MHVLSRLSLLLRNRTLAVAFGLLVMGDWDELTAGPTEDRVDGLRREIAEHDLRYYRDAAPVISDAEYDALRAELRQLLQHPDGWPGDVEDDVPIGDDRRPDQRIRRHLEPMLSLSKATTADEVAAFHARLVRQLGRDDLVYLIEPKYDGIALSLLYRQGELWRAVTRGDGQSGADVTAAARELWALPQQLRRMEEIAVPEWLELRAEVYLEWPAFHRRNAARTARGEAPGAHPRSVAAGGIQAHVPDSALLGELSLVVHGVGSFEPSEQRPESQQDLYARLQTWGLPVVSDVHRVVGGAALQEMLEALGRDRPLYPFPSDGWVVKLDARAQQQAVGNSRTAPRWAMARKFPGARVATRLRAVTWQVGRTGILAPVAELEPVEVEGSVIRRATLHNPRELARRDLRVGDWVWLEKAGAVIPAIVGVDRARRPVDSVPVELPGGCPSCGSELETAAGGASLRCPAADCGAQLQRQILHFASRLALDIAPLVPGVVGGLVERRQLTVVGDLYRLDEEALREVLAPEAARHLLDAIQRSRSVPLDRLLFGLGLPRVGAETSRQLASRFRSLVAVRNASLAELASTPGLGAAGAAVLHAALQEPSRRKAWDDLVDLGLGGVGPAGDGSNDSSGRSEPAGAVTAQRGRD